jgi:hypothetical protein
MSVLLAILGSVGAIALLVARSLAVDEIKGRLQRRITASVEATIAALPDELQAEWGDEWRAELAAVITMPLSAARFARGVRASAHELIAAEAPAPAAIDNHASTIPHSTQGTIAQWTQRALRHLLHSLGVLARRYGDAAAADGGLFRFFRSVVSVVSIVGAGLATLGSVLGTDRLTMLGAVVTNLGALVLVTAACAALVSVRRWR